MVADYPALHRRRKHMPESKHAKVRRGYDRDPLNYTLALLPIIWEEWRFIHCSITNGFVRGVIKIPERSVVHLQGR